MGAGRGRTANAIRRSFAVGLLSNANSSFAASIASNSVSFFMCFQQLPECDRICSVVMS